jgi:hypothetical protein
MSVSSFLPTFFLRVGSWVESSGEDWFFMIELLIEIRIMRNKLEFTLHEVILIKLTIF